MVQVSRANKTEYQEVASFYQSCGYSCTVAELDLVLLARENGELLGAVRLCQEENKLVLRGMYVHGGKQGQGIGTALLGGISVEIGDRECWCIPYTQLTEFYGRAGFEMAARGSAPLFLQQRMTYYKSQGKSVLIMVRPKGRHVVA